MTEPKTVFQFKKTLLKRFWNRFDYTARVFTFFFVAILITSAGTMRDGLRNTKALDTKDIWIKTSVRDLKREEFKDLDEEDPPVPLKPKTNVEQFRAEFSKMI